MSLITRRNMLGLMLAAAVGPAIVRASSLMPLNFNLSGVADQINGIYLFDPATMTRTLIWHACDTDSDCFALMATALVDGPRETKGLKFIASPKAANEMSAQFIRDCNVLLAPIGAPSVELFRGIPIEVMSAQNSKTGAPA